MSSKNKTALKLLPKTEVPDADQEGSPAAIVRRIHLYNIGLALITTVLLAFVLLPRTPRLEKGDTAPRNIIAPYTIYIEYQGPDQTILSFKVNKGELIVNQAAVSRKKQHRSLKRSHGEKASATGSMLTSVFAY
jgi:hypothetical protein